MARKRRLTQDHDNVGWIAYTDFVTALALVFVALFVISLKETTESKITIAFLENELRGRAGIEMENIRGSALFPRNSYKLTQDGEESMRDLALSLREQELLSDTTKVLAILGHTDDQPFMNSDSVDFNWTLSAQRAAAAAQFLIEKYPEYKCRIVPMGFGPSRPLEPVHSADDPATQRSKREVNRRLEFRVLNGSDLSASRPADC